jgi:sulfur carrier protein ThiS
LCIPAADTLARFARGGKALTIKLILRKKEYALEENSIQVKQALQQLNLSPESHLLVRNGELLNENDYLHDGDEVKIVAVISGGSGTPGGPRS